MRTTPFSLMHSTMHSLAHAIIHSLTHTFNPTITQSLTQLRISLLIVPTIAQCVFSLRVGNHTRKKPIVSPEQLQPINTHLTPSNRPQQNHTHTIAHTHTFWQRTDTLLDTTTDTNTGANTHIHTHTHAHTCSYSMTHTKRNSSHTCKIEHSLHITNTQHTNSCFTES